MGPFLLRRKTLVADCVRASEVSGPERPSWGYDGAVFSVFSKCCLRQRAPEGTIRMHAHVRRRPPEPEEPVGRV